MATIVNTQPATDTGNNGAGVIIGVILLLVVLVLFVLYGLPALRGGAASTGTRVNVPSSVNVHTGK